MQLKWVKEFTDNFMGLLSQTLYIHDLSDTFWYAGTPFFVRQKSGALVNHPDTNFLWLHMHSGPSSKWTEKENKVLNIHVPQGLKHMWAPAVTTVATKRSLSFS